MEKSKSKKFKVVYQYTPNPIKLGQGLEFLNEDLIKNLDKYLAKIEKNEKSKNNPKKLPAEDI